MFLPYDSVMNVWLTAVPTYEWEPVPPPPPQEPINLTVANDPNDPEQTNRTAPTGAKECGTASGTPAGLPEMRLVFKGMRWMPVPVWSFRENVAWEQVRQDHRNQDEENSLARARQIRRAPQPQDAGSGPQGTTGTSNTTAGSDD
jgi:hypothetical protein